METKIRERDGSGSGEGAGIGAGSGSGEGSCHNGFKWQSFGIVTFLLDISDNSIIM